MTVDSSVKTGSYSTTRSIQIHLYHQFAVICMVFLNWKKVRIRLIFLPSNSRQLSSAVPLLPPPACLDLSTQKEVWGRVWLLKGATASGFLWVVLHSLEEVLRHPTVGKYKSNCQQGKVKYFKTASVEAITTVCACAKAAAHKEPFSVLAHHFIGKPNFLLSTHRIAIALAKITVFSLAGITKTLFTAFIFWGRSRSPVNMNVSEEANLELAWEEESFLFHILLSFCILSILMREKTTTRNTTVENWIIQTHEPSIPERPKCDKSWSQLHNFFCLLTVQVPVAFGHTARQPYGLKREAGRITPQQNRLFLSSHTEFCHEYNPGLISKMSSIKSWRTSKLLHKPHFYQKKKLFLQENRDSPLQWNARYLQLSIKHLKRNSRTFFFFFF